MELEIGKRYHIKPVVVSPCLLSEGDYIVSHGGYSLGLRFQVTGDSIKEARPVNPYAQRLPRPKEIQQMLVDRGHDIVIDGKIGTISQDAWDYEVNNDYARVYFVKGE